MEPDNTHISASLEDYLEAIHHLEAQSRVARAKDIAEKLSVSRASVTGALKTLSERGLIHYTPYSYITLTSEGKSIAQEIIRRHGILKDFFEHLLRMPAGRSDELACRVEHAMDAEAVDRLVNFISFVRECPRTGSDWIQSFNRYCQGKPTPEACAACREGQLH